MKFFIIILFCIFCFSGSCKHKQRPNRICTYNIDSLAKNYDISKFTTKKLVDQYNISTFITKTIGQQGVVSLIESRSKDGEAGIYTFDKNRNLIFYGFLSDTNNIVNISIVYDSTGKEVNRTGGELANIYLRRLKSDSVAVTIFLVSINRIYKNLSLRSLNYRKEFGTLFYSDLFSNLISKTINIPFDFRQPKQEFYIEGDRYNTCSKQKKSFIDTIKVPLELFSSRSQ